MQQQYSSTATNAATCRCSDPTGSLRIETGFLPREEEYRLFTLVWKNLPGAQEARHTLIMSNLPGVRNFIVKHPGCCFFEREDVEQEAYVVLAECILHVPVGHPNPGAYLYRAAFGEILDRYRSTGRASSMDEEKGETEITLHDVLAVPASSQRTSAVSKLVEERLHLLPAYQQRALRDYFGLDFEPVRRKRDWHAPPTKEPTAKTAYTTRKVAYHALRGDQVLLVNSAKSGQILGPRVINQRQG